ncbi:MAG: hypothetical protein KKD31_05685 [Bacteroidetes bacterium]|nr:hypothetical protein [Bacteroidota bacterium]
MSGQRNIWNVTSGYRPIRDGKEYDKFFSKPNERDRVIIRNGDVEDTVELMKKVVWKYLSDTRQIAQHLKQRTTEETCRLIWDFLHNHIQYKLDKQGLEQLRRPARSWSDRNTGIDCDCFSIFISSILTNLHIPHKFRITKYDKDVYQHVYVVVPIERGFYVIDPVLSQANYEKPYKQKKDFTMSLNGINVAVLDGVNRDNDLIKDIISGKFDGLGSIQDSDATLQYLIQTRNQIASNPMAIATVEDPIAFIQMLDYAIQHWNTPQRGEAMKHLIQTEHDLNIKNGYNPDAISGLDDPNYEDGMDNDWRNLDDYTNADIAEYIDTIEEGHEVFDEEMERLHGLGYFGKTTRAQRKEKRAEKKEARQEKKADKKQQRKDLKEEKKQIKKDNKGKAKRDAMKEFRKENKRGFFQSVAKGVKAVVRYNPLTIAARNGFLLAMKLNLFKIAERLKWGYATPEQAQGKVTPDYHQKAKNALAQVEKLYADKLQGKKDKLKNAIMKGKSGGLSGLPDRYFSGLGEPISSTVMITAASGVIVSVLGIMAKNGLKNQDDPAEGDVEKKLKDYTPSDSDEQYYDEMDAESDDYDGDDGDSGSDDDDDSGGGGGGLWTFIKNNPMVLIGAAGAAVGIGWVIFKPKKKPATSTRKALSGTKKPATEKTEKKRILTLK